MPEPDLRAHRALDLEAGPAGEVLPEIEDDGAAGELADGLGREASRSP